MSRTTKRFNNGRTRPVRPPAKLPWHHFFRLRDVALKTDPDAVNDFLSDRTDAPPQNRDLFGK